MKHAVRAFVLACVSLQNVLCVRPACTLKIAGKRLLLQLASVGDYELIKTLGELVVRCETDLKGPQRKVLAMFSMSNCLSSIATTIHVIRMGLHVTHKLFYKS